MKKKRMVCCFIERAYPKGWMIMKLCVVFVVLFVFSGYANSIAQNQTVTLNLKQTSFLELFDEIHKQTGLRFIYQTDELNKLADVDVFAKDKKVSDLLNELLWETKFACVFEDDVIMLVPKAQQQTLIEITGRVTDEKRNPLPGVTIIIKGTSSGTATDTEGNFKLSLPKTDNVVLVFSFLGMETTEITYAGQKELQVVLKEAHTELESVVVTGIFNRPRESYTGAVTSITKQELQTFRGQNLIQTLRNIDPAINILENNLDGSNPNALPDITIRGSSSIPLSIEELNEGEKNNLNTPLVIMDGFEVSLEKLLDYNDEEIESINILKDASATAIYGSRGANGVIVIVSKQPEAGSLRINAKAGMEFEIPDLSSYDLLNAAEKLQLEYDNGFYSMPAYSPNPDTERARKQRYYSRLRDVLEGTDTYWLSKPLRTGITSNINLRLEGGSQEFRWSITTAYKRVNGVMKESYRDNFSGQVMLQYNYKNITFRNQTEIGINKGAESKYGAFSEYAKMNPYYKLHDNDGNLVRNFANINGTVNVSNPLYNASLNSFDESTYTQIINNLSIEWKIMEGLTLRGKVGLSRKSSASDKFVSPEHSSYESDTYYTVGDGVLERGKYTYKPGTTNSYDADLTLGYTRTFNDKHQLYAGLNYSILQRKTSTYTVVGIGFNNDNLNSLGNAMFYPDTKPEESENFTRSLGFTGNVNYTYDLRYYADASFRVDGSSQFGTNKRFAPFWSVGLGWNLHREAFLSENEVINLLRLKLSYGQTGSQQFSAYQAMRTFKYYTNDRYGNWGAAYLSGLGNEDLKWQMTDQINIGFELELWRKRLTLSFDFYEKKTSNLLSNVDIPYATGFSSYIANIGEVKNTGFEASMGGYLIRKSEQDILWTVNGKIAYNKNKITQLSEDIKRQTDTYMREGVDAGTLFYEGRAQNSLYVVRSLGIDPSTGNEVFLDKDGNTVYEWNAADKMYAGVQEPAYRGNISSMFRYKNFTLNLSFAYHWGGVIYNQTLIDKVEVSRSTVGASNVDRRVLTERWKNPGDMAKYKKIAAEGQTDTKTRGSSRFVMDDKVFQMQTASLEYRFSGDWLRMAGIQNAKFGVNMSDIFYLSSVKRERGINYPFARRIGASLSLMF